MSGWDDDHYDPSDPELLGATGWMGALGVGLLCWGVWAIIHFRLWEVALSWLS